MSQHHKTFHYVEIDPGVDLVKDEAVVIDLDHPLSDYWALTPNVVKLPEGGFRMYYTAGSHKDRKRGVLGYILSASSGDGLTWRRDPMIRMNILESNRETWVFCPDVIPLVGGGYRMFFQVQTRDRPDMILSAFSIDGMNWEREPLIKIGDGKYNYGSPRCLILPDGRYRLYFHRQPKNRAADNTHVIMSAISTNGIRFEIENDARIKQESALESSSVYAGEILSLGTGGYRMYYAAWNNDMQEGRILSALSHDGLNFIKDQTICIDNGGKYDFRKASEPCVIQLKDGRYRMFYEACDSNGQWRIVSATVQPRSKNL